MSVLDSPRESYRALPLLSSRDYFMSPVASTSTHSVSTRIQTRRDDSVRSRTSEEKKKYIKIKTVQGYNYAKFHANLTVRSLRSEERTKQKKKNPRHVDAVTSRSSALCTATSAHPSVIPVQATAKVCIHCYRKIPVNSARRT